MDLTGKIEVISNIVHYNTCSTNSLPSVPF